MADMAPWWAPRSGFWTSMARESNTIFLAGVFVLFFTGGLLSDISHLGAASWVKLIWLCCLAGGLAVAYVLVIRLGRAHWIILLVVLHALLAAKFDQIFGPFGPPLTGKALQTRVGVDVFATTMAMIVSFILLSHLHYRFATSEVVELSIAQLPLAMFSDTSYTSSNVPCAAGDLFVLLTDGLTEVFDGADQEFGLDRVKALMREEARGPLERLEARLLDAVHAHGLQLDDQTMFLIRREV